MKKKKEDQTVFNITDENYPIYKKIYNIKTGALDVKKVLKIGLLGAGSVVALAILSVFVTKNVVTTFNLVNSEISASIAALTTVAVDGAMAIPIMTGLPKIAKKLYLKKLKKEYPDIDINVNIDNLKEALTKYEELSKIPKNIEEKKEQCLTNHSDEFKKKTTEEKISELKEEIEFWEQVKIEEKYRDNYTEDSVKALKKTYNRNKQ